jgi:hypothetical protein
VRVKYPRTFHLPWSPGTTSDDKTLDVEAVGAMFGGREIVVTEKMDGENTTVYPDGTCHARSIDSATHPSRDWIRRHAAVLAPDIPEGYRLCGENVYAKHSLHYDCLPSYFLLFGIYDEDTCLSWDDTELWAEMIGLTTVPVMWRGVWDADLLKRWTVEDDWLPSCYGYEGEGYVVRLADSFQLEAFGSSVAKFVRSDHVQTDEHWLHQAVVKNELVGRNRR